MSITVILTKVRIIPLALKQILNQVQNDGQCYSDDPPVDGSSEFLFINIITGLISTLSGRELPKGRSPLF